MSFLWPAMLLSLLLIPVLVCLYLGLQRHRQRRLAAYGNLDLRRRSGPREHVPPAILAVGLALLLFALARPRMVVSLPRMEGTVLLAFDVSGSMAADDLQPSRLEAAKAAARGFVQAQPASVLVGVVAFSDNGFLVQAPTADQEAVLATIDRLAPERGTSLASGILASLSAIASLDAQPVPRLYTDLTPEPTSTPTPVPPGTLGSAAIVLLTDGENNESPDPLSAAEAAADRGIRIYCIGIGSAEGAVLHVNGFAVHTQLNEPMLQQISEITQGVYYSARSEHDLRQVYANLDPELVVKPEEMEVTSVFAGASVMVLLAGATLSLLWLSRLP